MSSPPSEPTPSSRHSWSLRVGSVAGIPIRIHFTFWLLLVWIAWAAHGAGQSASMQVALVLGLFGCIVLHELGHALTARRFGIGTRDITLYPIGGISSLKSMGEPRQELFISAAGPVVSVLIAAILYGVLLLSGQELSLEAVRSGHATFLQWLTLGNMLLAAFNILPAFPMDGGRVLRAFLALRVGKAKATWIAARVGQGFAVLMGLFGLTSGSILLMFIALFVFLGAQGEAGMQEIMETSRGYTVRDAMITRFETLSHGDSLQAAVDHLLRTEQEDFPVVHGDMVLGVLTRGQLLMALAREGRQAMVNEAMSRDFQRVPPDADLQEALSRLQDRHAPPLLVMDGDRLMGMVTRENVMELLAVARYGAVPHPSARPLT